MKILPLLHIFVLALPWGCLGRSPAPTLGIRLDKGQVSFQECRQRCLASLATFEGSGPSASPIRVTGDAGQATAGLDAVLRRHFKAIRVKNSLAYRHYQLRGWFNSVTDLELWFGTLGMVHFRIEARSYWSPDPLKSIEKVRFNYYQKNF